MTYAPPSLKKSTDRALGGLCCCTTCCDLTAVFLLCFCTLYLMSYSWHIGFIFTNTWYKYITYFSIFMLLSWEWCDLRNRSFEVHVLFVIDGEKVSRQYIYNEKNTFAMTLSIYRPRTAFFLFWCPHDWGFTQDAFVFCFCFVLLHLNYVAILTVHFWCKKKKVQKSRRPLRVNMFDSHVLCKHACTADVVYYCWRLFVPTSLLTMMVMLL